jgi:hypothetical protein
MHRKIEWSILAEKRRRTDFVFSSLIYNQLGLTIPLEFTTHDPPGLLCPPLLYYRIIARSINQGFAQPTNFTFTYPNNTGIAYSFDGLGHFEEAQYRFNANGAYSLLPGFLQREKESTVN